MEARAGLARLESLLKNRITAILVVPASGRPKRFCEAVETTALEFLHCDIGGNAASGAGGKQKADL
jgi:hypothetical protein